MKIYLDYIFLENLVLNLILLYQVSIFTKSHLKKTNYIIGTVFIAIYTTIVHIVNLSILNNIGIKIAVIFIGIYITFKPKIIPEYIKKIIYYFLLSFLYVGVIISISLLFGINLESIISKIIIYIISGVISYIFNKNMWKMWKSNIKKSDLTYKINIKGQEIIAFVDTGNNVKDLLTNLNVIFVDEKYKEKIIDGNKEVIIGFNTIAESGNLQGYIVKDIEVYKNKEKVGTIKKIIMCFVKNSLDKKEYSALIGYDTYIENLKGVRLC